MSTATEAQPVDTNLSADDVAQYLRDHPDFFLQQDDLLTEIKLSHDSGNAISLMERQVAVLREQHHDARSKLHGLLDNAGYNEELFHSTRKLILALLEARDLEQLSGQLIKGLTEEFDIDHAQLTLFGEVVDHAEGVRFIEAEAAEERAPSMMKNAQPLCGPLREEELHLAFGNDSEVTSAAVVKLNYQRPLGLLALGSTNPQKFDPKMETDFVEYIADVLSRLVAPYIGDDD